MSQKGEQTPPASPSRIPSSCLSLSPLQSPIEVGSHADWIEAQLLSDMVPEDKWKVAVAQASKIPRRSPPTSEPDRAISSTSATPDAPVSATSLHMEEPATGESGEILDALLAEFEPSNEMEGEERGWGETLSHQAVEELNQWLQKSGDPSDSPPPPYDGEARNQNLSSQATKVESFPGSRPRGIPRRIRDQKESEERFHLLPIVAIEPFPEWEME